MASAEASSSTPPPAFEPAKLDALKAYRQVRIQPLREELADKCRRCASTRTCRRASRRVSRAPKEGGCRRSSEGEVERELTPVRLNIRALGNDYEKTEDDMKALQSVGQIIGEVLKQLDDERCE